MTATSGFLPTSDEADPTPSTTSSEADLDLEERVQQSQSARSQRRLKRLLSGDLFFKAALSLLRLETVSLGSALFSGAVTHSRCAGFTQCLSSHI